MIPTTQAVEDNDWPDLLPSQSTQGTIVVASQPEPAPEGSRSRGGSRGGARAGRQASSAPSRGCRGAQNGRGGQSTGRQSGLNPSIRRTPSQWEGVSLDASDARPSATPDGLGGSGNTIVSSSRARNKRTTATQSPKGRRAKKTRGGA